jgi:antitoxin component YwqK of YwqJK toxin-antitoxin module
MLAYKAAKHDSTRVLITLEIPDDALTNLSRKNIAVKETAAYRSNKAKVLNIEDDEGNIYPTATTSYMTPIQYIMGEMIEEPAFDMSLINVSAQGIHFFLDKTVAKSYGLEKVNNGVFTLWHPNGNTLSESHFKDDVRHGTTLVWFETGQLWFETCYENGELHHMTNYWYENGQKAVEISYHNGKMNGMFNGWYENGKKRCEVMYVHGKIHGQSRRWSEDGILTEITFEDGVPQGQDESGEM